MKIVQITAIPETDRSYEHVYALCDDGAMWALTRSRFGPEWNWYKVPAIPKETT